MDVSLNMELIHELFLSASHDELVKFRSGFNGKEQFHSVKWLKKEQNLRKVLNSFEEQDLFFTFNTFKNKKKASSSKENLFNVYSFAIDVDYKRGKDRKESVETAVCCIKDLWNHSFGNLIPMPGYVEYGNQFRLIYLLKGHVSGEKQMKALELVQRHIVDLINACTDFDFCAEVQPLNSFMRVPSSYNGKNANYKNCRWDGERYVTEGLYPVRLEKQFLTKDGYPVEIDTRKTLSEYMDEVLGEFNKPVWYDSWKHKGKAEKNKKKKRIANLNALNRSRMEDIEKIQEYYIRLHDEKGHRNKLCFAYFNQAFLLEKSVEPAIDRLTAFNNRFHNPLNSSELKNCICTSKKRPYQMKTATLLNFLDISETLAKDLGLNLVSSAGSNAAYCRAYYEKTKKKKNTKKKKLKKQYKTIIRLRKKGKSNHQIAKSLKISEKSVERHITKLLREHKLMSKKLRKKIAKVIDEKKEANEFSGQDFAEKFCSAVTRIGESESSFDEDFMKDLFAFDLAYSHAHGVPCGLKKEV